MAAGKQNPMRMMILLPMMFLLNKVDTSNPLILNSARAAFVLCQLVSIIAYWVIKQKILKKKDQTKIYVPAPGSPFDPTPNYSDCKETTYQEYELSKVDEYLKQTLIGAAISSFIHIKMEVNHVVMIQSIMTPMNLYDNPLVQAYLLGKRGDRIWNEKLEGEPLEASTEGTTSTTSTTSSASINITPTEAIAQALAAAEDADFDALWQVVKTNVNATTKEDGWTALMVACGSPLDTDAFIHKIVAAGANVLAVDGDGWSALHWSAFHGRPEAAEALLSKTPVKQLNALLALQAQDGRTALEVAQEEKNVDVVQVIESYTGEKKEKKKEESELRRRKPAKNETTSVDDVD